MKFLVDNNLSYKILNSLFDCAGSVHVSDALNNFATDYAIWEFAKQNDFIILSKDNDFNEISRIRGCPPKVVQLLCGNQTTGYIAALINKNLSSLNAFHSQGGDCLLILYN